MKVTVHLLPVLDLFAQTNLAMICFCWKPTFLLLSDKKNLDIIIAEKNINLMLVPHVQE